ncbi:MAG: hypothetical protein OEM91_14580 [Hyphomicrobiales bacterium]|nr:hypothetical protein [Hyphomicrobiales bacterium]
MTRRLSIAALTFLAVFIASCTTTQSTNEGPALADSKVTIEQKIERQRKQEIERPKYEPAAESEKQENKVTGVDVAGFILGVLLMALAGGGGGT